MSAQPVHEHRWKLRVHIDGCHFFSSTYWCPECGATRCSYSERDIEDDPYSTIWMLPEGKEECERCTQLLEGAKPVSSDEIMEPAA